MLYNLLIWIGRVSAVISICIISLFLIGEGFQLSTLNFIDYILFICFPTTTIVGFIISFFKTLNGAYISITGTFMFLMIHFLCVGVPGYITPFLVFTSPSLFFIIAELKYKNN